MPCAGVEASFKHGALLDVAGFRPTGNSVPVVPIQSIDAMRQTSGIDRHHRAKTTTGAKLRVKFRIGVLEPHACTCTDSVGIRAE